MHAHQSYPMLYHILLAALYASIVSPQCVTFNATSMEYPYIPGKGGLLNLSIPLSGVQATIPKGSSPSNASQVSLRVLSSTAPAGVLTSPGAVYTPLWASMGNLSLDGSQWLPTLQDPLVALNLTLDVWVWNATAAAQGDPRPLVKYLNASCGPPPTLMLLLYSPPPTPVVGWLAVSPSSLSLAPLSPPSTTPTLPIVLPLEFPGWDDTVGTWRGAMVAGGATQGASKAGVISLRHTAAMDPTLPVGSPSAASIVTTGGGGSSTNAALALVNFTDSYVAWVGMNLTLSASTWAQIDALEGGSLVRRTNFTLSFIVVGCSDAWGQVCASPESIPPLPLVVLRPPAPSRAVVWGEATGVVRPLPILPGVSTSPVNSTQNVSFVVTASAVDGVGGGWKAQSQGHAPSLVLAVQCSPGDGVNGEFNSVAPLFAPFPHTTQTLPAGLSLPSLVAYFSAAGVCSTATTTPPFNSSSNVTVVAVSQLGTSPHSSTPLTLNLASSDPIGTLFAAHALKYNSSSILPSFAPLTTLPFNLTLLGLDAPDYGTYPSILTSLSPPMAATLPWVGGLMSSPLRTLSSLPTANSSLFSARFAGLLTPATPYPTLSWAVTSVTIPVAAVGEVTPITARIGVRLSRPFTPSSSPVYLRASVIPGCGWDGVGGGGPPPSSPSFSSCSNPGALGSAQFDSLGGPWVGTGVVAPNATTAYVTVTLATGDPWGLYLALHGNTGVLPASFTLPLSLTAFAVNPAAPSTLVWASGSEDALIGTQPTVTALPATTLLPSNASTTLIITMGAGNTTAMTSAAAASPPSIHRLLSQPSVYGGGMVTLGSTLRVVSSRTLSSSLTSSASRASSSPASGFGIFPVSLAALPSAVRATVTNPLAAFSDSAQFPRGVGSWGEAGSSLLYALQWEGGIPPPTPPAYSSSSSFPLPPLTATRVFPPNTPAFPVPQDLGATPTPTKNPLSALALGLDLLTLSSGAPPALPSATATASYSWAATPSSSTTTSPAASFTPTVSAQGTLTRTFTPAFSPSATNTPSATPSVSGSSSFTPSVTPNQSPSLPWTPSYWGASLTPGGSSSPSAATASNAPSSCDSSTPAPSFSLAPSASLSSSESNTATPQITLASYTTTLSNTLTSILTVSPLPSPSSALPSLSSVGSLTLVGSVSPTLSASTSSTQSSSVSPTTSLSPLASQSLATLTPSGFVGTQTMSSALTNSPSTSFAFSLSPSTSSTTSVTSTTSLSTSPSPSPTISVSVSPSATNHTGFRRMLAAAAAATAVPLEGLKGGKGGLAPRALDATSASFVAPPSTLNFSDLLGIRVSSGDTLCLTLDLWLVSVPLNTSASVVSFTTSPVTSLLPPNPIQRGVPYSPTTFMVYSGSGDGRVVSQGTSTTTSSSPFFPPGSYHPYAPLQLKGVGVSLLLVVWRLVGQQVSGDPLQLQLHTLVLTSLNMTLSIPPYTLKPGYIYTATAQPCVVAWLVKAGDNPSILPPTATQAAAKVLSALGSNVSAATAPPVVVSPPLPSTPISPATWATDAWAGFIGGGSLRPTIIHCHAPLSNISLLTSPSTGFDLSTNFTLTAQVLPDTLDSGSVSDAGVRATTDPSILLSTAALVSLQQPLPPAYYAPLRAAYGGASALAASGAGGATTPTVSSANSTLLALLTAASSLSVSPTPSSLLSCPTATDSYPALPFWSIAAQAASQALAVSPTTACASLYIASSTMAVSALNGGRPLTLPPPTPPSFSFFQTGGVSALDLLKGRTLTNPALFGPPPSGLVWTTFGTPLSSLLPPSLSPTLTSVFLPYTGNTAVASNALPSSWPSITALNASVNLFVLAVDEEGGVGVGGGSASIAPSFPFTSSTYAALSTTPLLGVEAVASALTTLTTTPPYTISPANALALLATLPSLLPTVTTPTVTSVSKALALQSRVAPLRASIAASVLSSLALIGGGGGVSVSNTTGAVTLLTPLPLFSAATAQQAAAAAQWKVDTSVALNPSLALLSGLTLAAGTSDTSFTAPSPATTLVIPALASARATALLSLPACVLTGAAPALSGGYATLPLTTSTFPPSIASAILTTVANSIPTLNFSSATGASSINPCVSGAGSNCTFSPPATLRPFLLRAVSSVVAASSSASMPSTSPPLYLSARVTPTPTPAPTPSLPVSRDLQASAVTTSNIRAYLNNPATFSLSAVTHRVFTGGASAVTLTLPVSFPPVAAIPAAYSPISLAVAASLTVSNYSLLKGSAAAVGVFVGAGVPPPTLSLPAATLLAVGAGGKGLTFDVTLTQWGVSGLAETSGWSSQAYFFSTGGVVGGDTNTTSPGLGKSNGTASSPTLATAPPYILTPPSSLAHALQMAPRQVDTLTIPPSHWTTMNTPSTAVFPPTSSPLAGVYPDAWSAFSATGLSQYARVYGAPLLDLVPGRPLDTRALTVSVGAIDGVTAPPLLSMGVYQNTSLVLDTPATTTTTAPAVAPVPSLLLNDSALPSPSISLVLPLIDPLAPGGGGLAPYLTANPPIAYSVKCPGGGLAGAAQPSDFTSAASSFPVPGIDSVSGSIRYVYSPTLNGSFVPTPSTPTFTALPASLPLSKITYISVTAYTGGVRDGTLSALPSQVTGGGWGTSANTQQPLPPSFLAGVKTGRSFPIRAPIFSLTVDCGPDVGARAVHCGPGFYGASVWYTCPVLTPLATCAVWNESSGVGGGRFTTSQCTATLPLASSATSPPLTPTLDALASAASAAASAGEGVGGLTLATAIAPATKGIACACSGLAGGTFGGRFAGVAVETPDSFLVATVILGDPRSVTPGSSLWVMFFIPAAFWLYSLRVLGKKDRRAALPFVRALLEDEEIEALSGFDCAMGLGVGGGGGKGSGFSLDALLDSTVLGALEMETQPNSSSSSSLAIASSPSSAPSSRQIHSPAFATLLHASSPHPLSSLVTKGYHQLYSGGQRKVKASHPVSSYPPPTSPTEKTFNPLTSVIEGSAITVGATTITSSTPNPPPRPLYASLLSTLSPLKVTLQGITEEGVLQAGGVRKDVYAAVRSGDYRWMALMRLVRDSSKVQWGEIDGEEVGEEEGGEAEAEERQQQQQQEDKKKGGRGGVALAFLPRVSLCYYIFCLRLRLTQPILGTLYTFDPTFPRLHRALAVGVTSLVGLFLSAYLLAFRNGIPGQDLLPNGATDWESLAVGTISAGLQFIVYLAAAACIKRTMSTPYWRTRYPSLAKELLRRGVGDHSLRHLSPRLLSVELGGPCASALHGAHPGHPGLLPPGILYERALEDARTQQLNSLLASQRGAGGMGGGASMPNFTPHSPASPGSLPQYPSLAQQPLPPMAIPRWGGNKASSSSSISGRGQGSTQSLAVGREPWHYGFPPPPTWAIKSIPLLKGVWKGWETAVEKEVEKETLKLNAVRAVRATAERAAAFSSSPASPLSFLGNDRLAEKLGRVGEGRGVGVGVKKGGKKSSVLSSTTSPTSTALPVGGESASPRSLSRRHTTTAPKRAPLLPSLSLNPHSIPTLLALLALAALSAWCVAYIFTFSATQSSGASSSASIAFTFSFFALHCIIQPMALGLLLILQVILAPTLATLTRWWCPAGVRRWGEGVWGESMDPQGGTSWPLWARLALLVLPRAAGAAEGLPAFASVLANDNIHLVLAALTSSPTPTTARVSERGEVGEALRRELIKRRYILARLKGIEAAWQGGGGGKGKLGGGGGGRPVSPFPAHLPVQYPPTLAPWAVLSTTAYAPPSPPSPTPVLPTRQRSDSAAQDTPKVIIPPPVWLSSSSSSSSSSNSSSNPHVPPPPRAIPTLPLYSNPLLRATSASSRVLGGGGTGGYTPRVVEDPSLATPNILIKALLAKNVVRRPVDNQ